MLDEEYLWNVPDSVVAIWRELEEWIIQDICSRIMAAELYDYNKIPGVAIWRMNILKEAGMHYSEMIKVIAHITRKSEDEVKKLFEESGIKCLDDEAMVFENQGIEPLSLMESSILKNILQECYDGTNGEIKNFTRTTATKSQKLLIDTLDKAYFEVTTGAKSYTEAIRDAVNVVAQDGATVIYDTGHKDTLETAVRRAVLTGINQGAGKISIANARELGAEYVVVSAHVGARTSEDPIANHSGWQGKVYKIDGEDHYPNLEKSTGFPTNPLGLCGYNCRHTIHAYFLGEKNPFANVVTDKKFSDKQYELSQKQRRMERGIRKSKRILMALQTAIDNCKDEHTKFELQMEYDKAAATLQHQNQKYREFCEENAENGIKTEQERLRTLKWDREQADKARSGAYRHNSAANISSYNTMTGVKYNDKYNYSINLPEYSETVNKALSKAADNVAKNGSRDQFEYLQLVNLKDGSLEKLMTDRQRDSVGGHEFWDLVNANKDKEYAFVHNHNSDSGFSETDMRTLLTTPNIRVMVAVRNDAVKYIATREGDALNDAFFDKYYAEDLDKLNKQYKDGIITAGQRARLREEVIVNNLLRDYTKQKGLYEIDGRK